MRNVRFKSIAKSPGRPTKARLAFKNFTGRDDVESDLIDEL
jgi:hypothetical protein